MLPLKTLLLLCCTTAILCMPLSPVESPLNEENPVARSNLDEDEIMDTAANSNIFPPAFAMLRNEKKKKRKVPTASQYLLVEVASLDNIPIVANAAVIPFNPFYYQDSYGNYF